VLEISDTEQLETMKTYFLKLDDRAIIPKYATEKSSGFDLQAIEEATIGAGETVLVRTGLSVILPADSELQVRPRSGLSLRTGLRIANSPGTIDEDYQLELGIICSNVGPIPLLISPGDKIAQGVICPIYRTDNVEVNPEQYADLAKWRKTSRSGGFGSTEETV
jgi:dUTP pyrophosphatase